MDTGETGCRHSRFTASFLVSNKGTSPATSDVHMFLYSDKPGLKVCHQPIVNNRFATNMPFPDSGIAIHEFPLPGHHLDKVSLQKGRGGNQTYFNLWGNWMWNTRVSANAKRGQTYTIFCAVVGKNWAYTFPALCKVYVN